MAQSPNITKTRPRNERPQQPSKEEQEWEELVKMEPFKVEEEITIEAGRQFLDEKKIGWVLHWREEKNLSSFSHISLLQARPVNHAVMESESGQYGVPKIMPKPCTVARSPSISKVQCLLLSPGVMENRFALCLLTNYYLGPAPH